MPDKHWEPPPGQEDRDRQPRGRDTDQPRKVETGAQKPDADPDVRYALDAIQDEINFEGSER